MPKRQSLTNARFLPDSELLRPYPCAGGRLGSRAAHQIHLMKLERTRPQWEKRETPNHSFGNTDFPQGVPYLELRNESTLKPIRLPLLVSKDGCHPQASHILPDAALSPNEIPLFLSKMGP